MPLNDPRDICFRNESNKETDKTEGFADDTTVLTKFELSSLSKIKLILLNFGSMSGLKCNVEKTALMQVGTIIPITDEITRLGFSLVNSIKILGMEIDFNIENLDQNFQTTHASIKRSIEYWKRYKLTLPGRISVIKSLLISLLNYMGCILTPKRATLNALQKTLDEFALSGLNVAKNRICIPTDAGGLGLFDIEEFLASQQCKWVIKADQSSRDIWRVNMRELSLNNPMCLSSQGIDPERNPIIFNISKSFEKLRVWHDSLNENFLYATVLQNPLIYRAPRDKLMLNPEFLEIGHDPLLCNKISRLTVQDCFGQYGLISRAEFRITFDVDMPISCYAKLGRAVNHFVNRFSVNRMNDGTSKTLRSEIAVKKPGKKIRYIFSKRIKKKFNVGAMQTTKTFFRIIDLEYIGNESFSLILTWWSKTGFTNRQKMFYFKFYNNLLGLNSRVSHFDNNVSRVCTFCAKSTPQRAEDESFLHLFYSCMTTRAWQKKFWQKCFTNEPVLTLTEDKKFWFLGLKENLLNAFIVSAVLTFQFGIWEAKLSKKIPSFHTLYSEFSERFSLMLKHNSAVRKDGLKLNYDICRQFLGGLRGFQDE